MLVVWFGKLYIQKQILNRENRYLVKNPIVNSLKSIHLWETKYRVHYLVFGLILILIGYLDHSDVVNSLWKRGKRKDIIFQALSVT